MTTILIAEDEPGVAMALEDDLRLEGWEVEVVRDGESAARKARESPFDLILLDVMLPRRDGFDVCRLLRAAGVETPIILLTARSQESDKVLGLELGADDYVTKPFSPRELRARIHAVLRRRAGQVPEIYRFGNVEIDFTRHEVRRNGEILHVTPMEFDLLQTFVRRKGRVLSRDQLIAEVWGVWTYISDRVIDTHVTNLRKKIEPVPKVPRYLVSVRGTGYRFDG